MSTEASNILNPDKNI